MMIQIIEQEDRLETSKISNQIPERIQTVTPELLIVKHARPSLYLSTFKGMLYRKGKQRDSARV